MTGVASRARQAGMAACCPQCGRRSLVCQYQRADCRADHLGHGGICLAKHAGKCSLRGDRAHCIGSLSTIPGEYCAMQHYLPVCFPSQKRRVITMLPAACRWQRCGFFAMFRFSCAQNRVVSPGSDAVHFMMHCTARFVSQRQRTAAEPLQPCPISAAFSAAGAKPDVPPCCDPRPLLHCT
ncbi:MAG: hypothetical protein RI925_1667 [Pseudomonadota bacterium]|jgi:hypothetical protein